MLFKVARADQPVIIVICVKQLPYRPFVDFADKIDSSLSERFVVEHDASCRLETKILELFILAKPEFIVHCAMRLTAFCQSGLLKGMVPVAA